MNSIPGTKPRSVQDIATTNLTLPQQISRMDPERLRAYRENLEFYNGAQWLGHSRSRERRLTFNYAKVFVDKVTSYLMSGLSFAIDPASAEDREKSRRAEEAIYKVYESRRADSGRRGKFLARLAQLRQRAARKIFGPAANTNKTMFFAARTPILGQFSQKAGPWKEVTDQGPAAIVGRLL